MNPDEYAKLDRIDRDHWFYRGKRAIVRHWIDRYLKLKPDDLLVDAGAGTGTWLAEMARTCRVLGLDDHQESIDLARPKVEAAGGEVRRTSLEKIDLPDGAAAVTTAMDVLEHLPDDVGALKELIRITRPGGLVVITVPALMMLWSDWDVVLHHHRRYTRRGLTQVVRQPGVEVLRVAYFNSLLLPAIFAVRAVRKVFPPKPGGARAEDWVPPGPVNRVLYELLVRPACRGWFHPPAGVSLLAVLRRMREGA